MQHFKEILLFFSKMEETGILNTSSIIHLHSIHFVVLPLLQKAIDSLLHFGTTTKCEPRKTNHSSNCFFKKLVSSLWTIKRMLNLKHCQHTCTPSSLGPRWLRPIYHEQEWCQLLSAVHRADCSSNNNCNHIERRPECGQGQLHYDKRWGH